MEIDWYKLKSCGGHSDASELPKAVDLLFSENLEDRERGYWEIENHAVVQSDLYNSALYVARILVDRYLIEKVVSK
ncbi:hypothetical protein [Sessilibacter corallicola]|uniref:Uncharacterized protein n=1 Tax=Sessilibacter corallicola TaxID=2904075 RepID=A0ABQ0AF45_9GAMM